MGALKELWLERMAHSQADEPGPVELELDETGPDEPPVWVTDEDVDELRFALALVGNAGDLGMSYAEMMSLAAQINAQEAAQLAADVVPAWLLARLPAGVCAGALEGVYGEMEV